MRKPALVLLLLLLAGPGCAYMPPQKIPMDRANYIEAISTSWKEQLLTNLVKLRYGDTLTFLEMTSVTTGYELAGGASAGFFRAWNNPFWHSVSATGSVSYIDRPTITYAPLKGEALSKTVMVPLPVSATLRSLQTGWRAEFIFSCCIESINGLRNRSPSGHFTGDPEFFALACHFGKLSRHGVIRIAIDQVKESTEKEVTKRVKPNETAKSKKKAETPDKVEAKLKMDYKDKRDLTKRDKGDITLAYLIIDKSAIERTKDTEEREKLQKALDSFYNLLNLHPDADLPKFMVIDGNREPKLWGANSKVIVLQTRSIFESLTLLSRFIEMPGIHIHKDIDEKLAPKQNAEEMKWLNCVAGNINKNNHNIFIEQDYRHKFRILHSITPPPTPFVAIKYHDFWFYIEDTDVLSKFIFSGIAGIFSMSEPTTKELTPVLTLPVQ